MSDSAKRKRISQTDIPSVTLEQALRVPRAIAEQYGKAPTRPFNVAEALNMSPSSGTFRALCGAAIGYGLTEGGPNAEQIALAPLGRRIVAPLEEGDDKVAEREAVLSPTVERAFLEKYDGSPLPNEKIAKNVLEELGVPAGRTEDVLRIILENASRVGFLKTIKEKQYVDLEAATNRTKGSNSSSLVDVNPEAGIPQKETREDDSRNASAPNTEVGPTSTRPNSIFIGHGSNKKPLDQLTKILGEYHIPHKIAVFEPNAGRPIPTKVAETMRECGAAILIFTADKQYHDENGEAVWRPSENVIYELGAASVLYDNRIVIFKEKGVSLATNFSSIGYIEFEPDRLNEKGIELFRELVNFKIVRITVGQ